MLGNIVGAPSSAAQWCAAAQSSPAVGNYVNLTFSEEVVVEGVVSRGLQHIDDGISFVSRFSLHYQTNQAREDLQQYNKVRYPSTARVK